MENEEADFYKKPIFEIICKSGKHYKIWLTGKTEGFDDDSTIVNRIPLLKMFLESKVKKGELKMGKILLNGVIMGLLIALLCIILAVVTGCHEANQTKSNLPDKWVERFGDSPQSELEFNMARNQALHRKILTALADRIGKLEDGAIMEGDRVNLLTVASPNDVWGMDTIWLDAEITKADPNSPDPNSG